MNLGHTKKQVLVREYALELGIVLVYDNYMVAIFNEGATLTLERMYQIIGISEIHFRDKDFGYVSLRKNSYAIDPTVYNYLRQLDNLKAFAVVSLKQIDMHNFNIEKLFYKNSMKFFIDYENAIEWVKTKLKSK